MINNSNREALLGFPAFKAQYDKEYADYVVDDTVVAALKPLLLNKDITIVWGAWCGDSKLQVPRFYKVLDAAGFPDDAVSLITVDEDKKTMGSSIDDLNIEKVPTFIIFEKDQALGRIVECPAESLEKDMLSLLLKYKQ
jgi:thiol-disulfide isomerase/thioredoxin